LFDEFRLERELGRGGMGVVYLAHDTRLDRKVAIKFIASERPELRSYFENEARLLASFQHPNILTIFSFGEVDGHPYIVSEYIVGQSLAHLERPLPWRRVLRLGAGLARGLAAAHRQGVLHRDIKPSNAIQTESGAVKLLDFGLAERVDPAASAGSRAAAGTLLYMAPECRAGAPATPRSDLYSLGLVLHELCAGRLPEERLDGTVAGLGSGVDVDPDLAAIIERCVRSDPKERFASADLLCEALERLERIDAPAPLAAGNPYRGLAPFEAEHRAFFFGRDADILAVLDRLRRQQLVLVAGDSGVGKSSLCRAGILPRAATDLLDGGRKLTTLTLSPGRRPLETLAAALAPILSCKEAELFTTLADTPGWLGQRLREMYQREGGLLLFVDQLEELLTLSEPGQAWSFARILGELALPAPAVRTLLAVRGDFFTRLTSLPGLGDEAERALYLLRPLSAKGLRQAIVDPARACGAIFESEALIYHLVESTAHGSSGLPLLQFALAELWERRDIAGGRITQRTLDEMGGLAALLSRHADGVVARLDAAQQMAARRLLMLLVTPEGTRGERSEDELDLSSHDGRVALDALLKGRLVQTRMAGGLVHYRIAHDSLIERWELLRHWLDSDIGLRAMRKRVEEASAEWARLGRPRDLLWLKPQLDQARPLDPSTLGPREAEFIQASRRRVARRRWLRRLAASLSALTMVAFYLGLRLALEREDRRKAEVLLSAARDAREDSRRLGLDACARREQAISLYTPAEPAGPGPGRPPGDASRWEAAEQRWTAALEAYGRADAAYLRAEQALQNALDYERGRAAARRLLSEVTFERLELEECFHPQGARAESVRRLQQRFEDADWRARVEAPAELMVLTDPPGAAVSVERYVDHGGALRREPVTGLGPLLRTPVERIALSPGSYHLRIGRPDRVTVDLPVLLKRGTRERIEIALPATVPGGFVYVPPGCFLVGSDDPERIRSFMRSPPLHRSCMTGGYLIGRTEITFGDWLRYLESLPPHAPARRILEQPRPVPAGAVTLRPDPICRWVFSFERSGASHRPACEGEDFKYRGRERRASVDWRQLPLSGVSAEDLHGYLAWLDRSGRPRGARLCTEHEWERAARGADGRAYPGGDRLAADDANMDITYGRKPEAYGPDMVGAHPASASPFGVLDMAGNADEMTLPVTEELGRIVLRGGGWYHDLPNMLIANRASAEPTLRDAETGARICAPYPHP
jgi:formylglycine-generating enzyme required for sulfatase activity/predicted Ser/Thr protein kinase